MIIIGNKLIADEGMTLTNGDAFGKTVWLASGDDGSMWREITDAEAADAKEITGEEFLAMVQEVL